MAEKKYKPSETLLLALEGRAEAISGEFKPQDVANTLWAYATMGRKPGGRMMGILELRAQATAGKSFFTVDELISRSSIEKIRALASMN